MNIRIGTIVSMTSRCAVGLLLLMSLPVRAFDAQGNYAVWGIGQTSCHQFGKAYEAGDLGAYKAYLSGFLTAYNAMAKDVYQITGRNTLKDNLAALDAHCAKNPMDSFERGIQALIEAGVNRPAQGSAAWSRGTPAQ